MNKKDECFLWLLILIDFNKKIFSYKSYLKIGRKVNFKRQMTKINDEIEYKTTFETLFNKYIDSHKNYNEFKEDIMSKENFEETERFIIENLKVKYNKISFLEKISLFKKIIDLFNFNNFLIIRKQLSNKN